MLSIWEGPSAAHLQTFLASWKTPTGAISGVYAFMLMMFSMLSMLSMVCSMPAPLPSTPVPILGLLLMLFTAVFADENPGFAFAQLHTE
ncbi:MAG: hypothetical protein AAF741_16850 [Bacteroidota bacterium]